MIIDIEQDYWSSGKKLFEKSTIDLQPGLTVLVGCNGSGKSTLLHIISEHCRKFDIPHIEFNNLVDGGDSFAQMMLNSGKMNALVEYALSSEGEVISMVISQFVNKLHAFIANHTDASDLVVTVDALDSGLSIDNIVEMKRWIFHRLIDECNTYNIHLYVVLTTNTYEFAKNENCLYVPALVHKHFKSYEDYRACIIASRKKKNKRYNWDKFADDE